MIEDFAALTPDEVTARLAGSPEERAELIRAGAEAGVAEAQAVYGQMLLDAGEAAAGFGWFVRAARQGHLLALNMVGRCYDLGWGVAVDKPRAAECFRVAAERGLDWGMYNYATLLALGEGVAEDRPAALAWLRKAAALGNAKAINFVGSFHEDGWVVERDLALAAEHYARAAEGGDFRGCFNHARMLIQAGDRHGALRWLARIGECGATEVFKDKCEAWLRASADPLLRDEGVAALRRPC
jgi:TPR repeat protein